MTRHSYQSPETGSQNDADQRKAREASIYAVSAESELPSWVRKHAPCVSEQPKPEFSSQHKQKSIGANCSVAPLFEPGKLLTVAEAAWFFSLSEKTIRRMISAGSLAVIRLGRSIRIDPEVIEKIMRQNK